MKHIDANTLKIVRGAFKGKKLEKLDKAIALIEAGHCMEAA